MRIFLPCLAYRGSAGIFSKEDTNALGPGPCPSTESRGKHHQRACAVFGTSFSDLTAIPDYGAVQASSRGRRPGAGPRYG